MTRGLLVIACVSCAAVPLRWGASCPSIPPSCEALAKADLVFIADVLEATSVPRRNDRGMPYPEGITNYRFNVVEGVKGIEPGEFRAQFYYGGGSDLNSFGLGLRYLIFANRAATGIYKSGCSLTREIRKTGEGEWLRAMRVELDACMKRP